ncbi:MAG: cyclic peptide export ABC transporter [Alphaproteobacteria bacterium]|nr:cyclic peptide export ABC transporter [Alphaproteobacteria bacterium]MBU0797205.1 cyclic peptide export ABC transporter [Alphaproteobacteria bacterium]MBU0887124.1 cyclic peptide export ABC transporter [Alphaproteobacteria bacterium]MBU1814374.1 cyclic peptide export ABC transporter [Alphaproteobacteria bacterium]MBU2090298.1 cyclic peptide export ABC transporter [Alphaproteobacteria bacterium]
MNLLRLLAPQPDRLPYRILFLALCSGVASVVILALVNSAAEEIMQNGYDQVDWLLAGGTAVAAVVFLISQIWLIRDMAGRIETGIHRVRVQLLELLRIADYRQLEQLGQAQLFQNVTQNSQVISQNSQFLAMALQSLVLIVASLSYLLWISTIAFLLVVVVIAVAGAIYFIMGRELGRTYYAGMDTEARLFQTTTDLLDGIKEVRMSSARNASLRNSFAAGAAETRRTALQVHVLSFRQFIFGENAIYTLLGVVVFLVPLYTQSIGEDVQKITTIVLFVVGPVGAVLQLSTLLMSSEAACARIFQMCEKLSAISDPALARASPAPLPAKFEALHLDEIRFAYPAPSGETPFSVGPLSLSIPRGRITFITGGNGSGKSTLIKILTGLYMPQSGEIRLDKWLVGSAQLPAYREMIATVFSDYHLFRRLYGVPPVDPVEAAELLSLFELEQRVTISEGSFDTIDLSVGQRKRLALIAALLEHRPILVLDEWAADQDPQFRAKFYREILPTLRDRGLTIVAVTHDDHYFDVADHRVHLEIGRARVINGQGSGTSPTGGRG